MARILPNTGGNPLFTAEGAFAPQEGKVTRVVKDQGTSLERFVNMLKVGEALVENKAVGAVAGLAVKGVKNLSEAAEDAGTIHTARKAQEAQDALNARDSAPLKAQALQKLAESKAANMSGVEGDIKFSEEKKKYIDGLNKHFANFNPNDVDSGFSAAASEYLRNGVSDGFITNEQANKVVDMMAKKKDSLAAQQKSTFEQGVRGVARATNIEADLQASLENAQEKKKAESTSKIKDLMDEAKALADQASLESPEDARKLLAEASKYSGMAHKLQQSQNLTQEEIAGIRHGYVEAAKVQQNQREMTVVPPTDQKVIPPEAKKVIDNAIRIENLSPIQQQIVDEIVGRGKIAHGDSIMRMDELEKNGKLRPSQDAIRTVLKDQYYDKYDSLDQKNSPAASLVNVDDVIDSGTLSDLQKQVVEKVVNSGKKSHSDAILKLNEIEKKSGKLSDSQDAIRTALENQYADKYVTPALRGEGSVSSVLNAEDTERRNQLAQKSEKLTSQANKSYSKPAPLPEGVKVENSEFVIDRKKPMSEQALMAMASVADTPKLRQDLMAEVENADIAPSSLFDIMTGSHKRNFAANLTKMFPKATKPVDPALTANREMDTKLKGKQLDDYDRKAGIDAEIKTGLVAKNKREADEAAEKGKAGKAPTGGETKHAMDLRIKANEEERDAKAAVKRLRGSGASGQKEIDKKIALLDKDNNDIQQLIESDRKRLKEVTDEDNEIVRDGNKTLSRFANEGISDKKPTPPVSPVDTDDDSPAARKAYIKEKEKHNEDLKKWESRKQTKDDIAAAKERAKVNGASIQSEMKEKNDRVERNNVQRRIWRGIDTTPAPAKSSPAPVAPPTAAPVKTPPTFAK